MAGKVVAEREVVEAPKPVVQATGLSARSLAAIADPDPLIPA